MPHCANASCGALKTTCGPKRPTQPVEPVFKLLYSIGYNDDSKAIRMVTRRNFCQRLAAAASGIAPVLAAAVPQSIAAERINVFAAASLKNALDAVSLSWQATTSKEAAVTYAASSALAKQIENGAPADVFISADLDWMNYLADKNLLTPGSEVKLLGNELILIAPRDSRAEARIEANFPLSDILGGGKLAMADVKAVPAGKYGKAALEKLGVWASVEKNVAQAENVRAALKLVAAGEAALGIVYATDAKAEPSVRVVAIFPAGSHPEIVYPAATIATLANPDAGEFMNYLQSAKAKAIFEEQGFLYLAAVIGD